VEFVVPDVVVFIHAGVAWCAERAGTMVSAVVDAAAGGWQKSADAC
jgi:hypothetical protein